MPPKREAKLFCRYRHNNHPYLILRPIKEEQVLDSPVVFLYHDVVTDKEIDEIKALAMPRVRQLSKRIEYFPLLSHISTSIDHFEFSFSLMRSIIPHCSYNGRLHVIWRRINSNRSNTESARGILILDQSNCILTV